MIKFVSEIVIFDKCIKFNDEITSLDYELFKITFIKFEN